MIGRHFWWDLIFILFFDLVSFLFFCCLIQCMIYQYTELKEAKGGLPQCQTVSKHTFFNIHRQRYSECGELLKLVSYQLTSGKENLAGTAGPREKHAGHDIWLSNSTQLVLRQDPIFNILRQYDMRDKTQCLGLNPGSANLLASLLFLDLSMPGFFFYKRDMVKTIVTTSKGCGDYCMSRTQKHLQFWVPYVK